MEAEMKMVFQQKVQEKEQKLKQSEEELYSRHREMKEALEKQRLELEDKKRRIESGRPLTPEKGTVGRIGFRLSSLEFGADGVIQKKRFGIGK
jgi:septin 7